MTIINFDHLSAKPLLPEVKTAMIEAINRDIANPSSQHKNGEEALEELNRARTAVMQLINCQNPKEVIFTSGGTESVNHAIKGVAFANAKKGNHIVTSNIEHNSVIRSLKRLGAQGFRFTSVSVDESGRVDPREVENAITKDTILVSVMHANNETGTIQPIEEISEITRKKKVLFHTDAVDSVGVIPFDVQKMGADLVSFASNTFYGPTGVGGLYIRKGVNIWPLLDGGVQESSKRAGTENMIGIVGMGIAARYAHTSMETRLAHLQELQSYLLEKLPGSIDEYMLNGHPQHCLPNLVSVSLKYIEGESVMLMLDDENIAVATRSACATGSLRASHVLLSIGRSHADAQGTILISFGIDNKKEDIDQFLKALAGVVKTLRDISPLYQKIKD